MQTRGTRAVTVVVHSATFHRHHITHRVTELTAVNVGVVATDTLVRDDVTIFVNHETIGHTEQEQFILCRLARIGTNLTQEGVERLGVGTSLNHREHLAGDLTGERRTIQIDLIALEFKVPTVVQPVTNRGHHIGEGRNHGIIPRTERRLDLREIRMIVANRELRTVDEEQDAVRGNERSDILGHNFSFWVLIVSWV